MHIRPMEERDVEAVHAVSVASFTDLNARLGDAPYPAPDAASAAVRLRRLLVTDPGGAWVAERRGTVCGAALAFVRERLWGLSLLAVHPGAQSAGVGRELLARARAHGDGARGLVILASRDPRALRSYVGLGLALEPALRARGLPRGITAPPGLRPWRGGDEEWAGTVGRAVRGAAHGEDLDALRAAGAELTVLPGRGYAAARGGALKLLAAADEQAGEALLAAHLARAGDDGAVVAWITARQQWAVRLCVAAGLELVPGGAVMTAGELGRLSPYLPSGSYL